MMKYLVIASLLLASLGYPVPDGKPHVFDFKGTDFTLDGQPFRFVACELHYPRIPKAYWEHRLLMSKALGCNTVSAYVFWNYHEQVQGVFDFESEERNLGEFIRLAQHHQMWLFIRPGPYVCAEWDAGGHPWWLMKDDIKLRTIDPSYVQPVRNYVAALTKILSPLQVQNGGIILPSIKIENEYGYLGWDRNYVDLLKQIWDESGLHLKYYQAEPHDGVKGTHIQGAAIGINPGIYESYYQEARQVDSHIPLFSSETWLGLYIISIHSWFTHWGDSQWGSQDVGVSVAQVSFLISHGYSFSIYMAHGGTSFGFWAGANFDNTYQPDVTSYDYDCPINESGGVTQRYTELRALIKNTFALWEVPEVPEHVPYIEIGAFTPQPYTNILSAFRQGPTSFQPQTFEQLGQAFGLVAYTSVVGSIGKGSILQAQIHDYAQVYINSQYIGTIDRRLGEQSIQINTAFTQASNTITILVEAMGRINFGDKIYDQKGIIGSVLLSHQVINNWSHSQAPLDEVQNLANNSQLSPFVGEFFKAYFDVPTIGDTYLEMSAWNKGFVWVNGRNLGRFWKAGPQHRLYLPGAFLKQGQNQIIILDINQGQSQIVKGVKTLK